MSFEIINNRLKELEVRYSEFAYGDFPDNDEILGTHKVIKKHGGEGQGDEWYAVRYFDKYDVYVRIDGFYSSYNGTDFENDWYEVKPKEVQITVYE